MSAEAEPDLRAMMRSALRWARSRRRVAAVLLQDAEELDPIKSGSTVEIDSGERGVRRIEWSAARNELMSRDKPGIVRARLHLEPMPELQLTTCGAADSAEWREVLADRDLAEIRRMAKEE